MTQEQHLIPISEIESWECEPWREYYKGVEYQIRNIESLLSKGDFSKPVYDQAIRTLDLCKAVIPTPMKGGSMDWGSVPPGASIWITAKHGPMAGGHVLITKRADGLAAISGEMNRKLVTEVPNIAPFDPTTGGPGESEKKTAKKEEQAPEKRSKEIAARRHLAMRMDTVKVSKKAEEAEQERRQIQEEEAPQREVAKQLVREAGQQKKQAEEAILQAVGITKSALTKQEKEAVADAVKSHYLKKGLSEEEAAKVGEFVTSSLNKRNERLRQKKAFDRSNLIDRKLQEIRLRRTTIGFGAEEPNISATDEEGESKPVLPSGEWLGDRPLPVVEPREVAPDVPDQQHYTMPELPPNLSEPEMQHEIEKHFNTEESGFVPPQESPQELVNRDDTGYFRVTLGGEDTPTEDFVNAAIADEEAAQGILDAQQEYLRKIAEASEITKNLRGNRFQAKKFTSSATLEDMKLEITGAVTDADLDRISSEYVDRIMQGTAASSFYEAVGNHWNENLGNTLSQHVSDGAATALTALMPSDLGVRYEAGKLVESLGPESAARVLAYEIKSQWPESQYRKFMEQVRDHNAINLAQTENDALAKHGKLSQEMKVVEDDIKAGRLGEDTGAFYKGDNLEKQRRNLGVALGSMSASAAFYDALGRAAADNNASLDIMVGHSDIALKSKLEALNLKEGKQLSVEYNPQTGYIIHTNARYLNQKRFVSQTTLETKRNEDWENIKNDTSPVENYSAKGIRSHFPDDPKLLREAGLPENLAGQPIEFRQEQRNDLEWYKQSGGGVIARTTGAGKTLTALAAMGHEIARNPDYKGIIVVPKNTVPQWMAQAKAFTDLDVVQVPPEMGRYEDRREIYRSIKPGQILVVAHDHAGKQIDSLDIKEGMFDGAAIDEPQLLSTRKDGQFSTGASRLMKIDFTNRLALTATPARKSALEAYNLVKWANPQNTLGYRTTFSSAYGGFGEGTNAQDKAITDNLWGELSPYISGGKISQLPFDIDYSVTPVTRTAAQQQRAQDIEASVGERIKQAISAVPEEKHVGRWRAAAREKEMKSIMQDHYLNLHGGDAEDNAKAIAFRENASKALSEGSRKQIVFVDSHQQKQTAKEAVEQMGLTRAAVRDITKTQKPDRIEPSKQEWINDPDNKRPFILIDQSSSQGHNLQAATSMHFLGNPDEAAGFVQAVGRMARTAPGEKRKKVSVVSYRHHDSPFENQRMNEIDTQMKILRATAPAVAGVVR